MAAEQIVVSNFGVAANGMPYAIAMEKGFFKAEGADVSGILSSAGGGTTVRNLMTDLRSSGEVTGGPRSFAPRDRSAFLSALDQTIRRIQRQRAEQSAQKQS